MHLEPTEAWYLLHICAALIAIFLLAVHLIKLKKNVPLFYCWLGAIAVLGGAAAFFLPIAVNSGFAKEDDGSALRQALLYTTGGLLGVITLGETHRKNNQEKEKNENDHNRQVHAERRSRYTTAVEQLANEKAAVRLGGIYTLVGLVDEWIADDSLEPDEQQEEGQIIINNLCAYIRSPFPLAEKIEEYEAREELEKLQKSESEKLSEEESSLLQVLLKRFEDSDEYKKPKDITADYAKFHAEQDVRRAIFEEMSKRSSTVSVDESMNETIKSGAWSGFKFDFSRAQIFYPLKGITFEHPIFMESTFYKGSDFSQAYFVGDTDFKYAYFNNTLHFDKTYFIGDANFTEAKSKEGLYFTRTRFLGETYFTHAFFGGDAIFNWVRFKKTAHFNQSGFFSHTSFHATNFKGELGFTDAYFEKTANFRLARFEGPVNFSAFFKNESPSFVDSDGKIKSVAYFSYNVDKKKYNFFAITDSPHKIKLGKAELKGKKFRIPVGTRLFDPDSWNEKDRKYTESDPAEPVDESDEAEEDKTE